MKKIMVLMLIIFLMLVLSTTLRADTTPTENELNQPKKGTEEPDKVYARYVLAVHSGDINTIKGIVYSKSLVLWNNNGKQMLAMTKNNIPSNPVLTRKRQEKEYQYNYTVLSYTGQTTKGNAAVGEVKMIVENGVWKLYQENWRLTGR
jgi:hypothetical protein